MTRETREDQRRKDRSIVGARAGDEGNETGYAKGTAYAAGSRARELSRRTQQEKKSL